MATSDLGLTVPEYFPAMGSHGAWEQRVSLAMRKMVDRIENLESDMLLLQQHAVIHTYGGLSARDKIGTLGTTPRKMTEFDAPVFAVPVNVVQDVINHELDLEAFDMAALTATLSIAWASSTGRAYQFYLAVNDVLQSGGVGPDASNQTTGLTFAYVFAIENPTPGSRISIWASASANGSTFNVDAAEFNMFSMGALTDWSSLE